MLRLSNLPVLIQDVNERRGARTSEKIGLESISARRELEYDWYEGSIKERERERERERES